MKLFARTSSHLYCQLTTIVSLGTDGFGRSDSRENLRHHFEV